MRHLAITLLSILTLDLFSQDSKDCEIGKYHGPQFVNSAGDTLNKTDSLGLFHGIHLYSEVKDNMYNPYITHTIGNYTHGVPTGIWKIHCGNGKFSMGEFICDNQQFSKNENGKWNSINHSSCEKIGIWKFFDSDSILVRTKKYDIVKIGNAKIRRVYLKDTLNNFILTYYEYRTNIKTIFYKRNYKYFNENGQLVESSFESFWHDIEYKYYPNGKLKSKFSIVKFFGIYFNKTIEKKYYQKGGWQSTTIKLFRSSGNPIFR